MTCPITTTPGGSDSTKYVVRVGKCFIKRIDDSGDIIMTLAWELAKQCDDLTHAQSCAENYGGTVYKITRSLEPVENEEST